MAKGTSNSDPFNAAEPVLPWQEPSSRHDFTFGQPEVGYEPPEKQPDHYNPPSTRRSAKRPDSASADSSRSGAKRSGSKRSAARRSSSHRSMPRKVRSGSGDPLVLVEMPREMLEGKPPAPNASQRVEIPLSAQRISASQRANRIKILVITLLIVGVSVAFAGLIIGMVEDDLDDMDYSGKAYEVTLDIDEDAAEAEVSALLDERIAGMPEDSELVSRISASFSAECERTTGYSAADLGLDADAYATWLISGTTFTQDGVYCYDGYDGEAPEGHAYCDVYSYDTDSLVSDFCDEAYEYLSNSGYGLRDGYPALGDAQKSRIEQIYESYISAAQPDDNNYIALDFTYQDGAWSIDEEGYDEEMEYVFDI